VAIERQSAEAVAPVNIRHVPMWREEAMLSDEFNKKTLAIMELALERACRFLPLGLPEHETRKFVAEKIVECARNGNQSLAGLTEVGRQAVRELRELMTAKSESA
jgi:urease gamma subunit